MNVLATRQVDMVSGLLAEYAIGALSRPVSVAVEAHLELTGKSDRWIRTLDQVGDALRDDDIEYGRGLSSIEPVAFDDADAALSDIFASIDGAENGAASIEAHRSVSIEMFIGMSVADVPWKRVMPGIAEHRLPDVDGAEVSLLRIDGGKSVPVHTHHGSEITVVLQGGFSDGTGHYGVGDIAYADDAVNHRPVADEGEVCICFAVVDAPVELTGPFGRFVNGLRR
ncbi:MAG: ChrR family anti-sigma-E factor [Pseudomonadota bacterium]